MQGHIQERFAALDTVVKLVQKHDFVFAKNARFTQILDFEKANRIELSVSDHT